jgi:hypothetical protein
LGHGKEEALQDLFAHAPDVKRGVP